MTGIHQYWHQWLNPTHFPTPLIEEYSYCCTDSREVRSTDFLPALTKTKVNRVWRSVGTLDSSSQMKVSQLLLAKAVPEILRKRELPSVIPHRPLFSLDRVYEVSKYSFSQLCRAKCSVEWSAVWNYCVYLLYFHWNTSCLRDRFGLGSFSCCNRWHSYPPHTHTLVTLVLFKGPLDFRAVRECCANCLNACRSVAAFSKDTIWRLHINSKYNKWMVLFGIH